MNMKFWKWWTVVNIGVWTVLLGNWYYGLFAFLAKSDPTYITFVILAIGLVFAIFTFVNYKKIASATENNIYWFTSDSVLSLGMIGTLLGFLMVLGQAFVDIDPSQIETMTSAITSLATGMSTALITTLVGLTVGLWMKLQLVILEDS
jgi:uncharacterized membrane protein